MSRVGHCAKLSTLVISFHTNNIMSGYFHYLYISVEPPPWLEKVKEFVSKYTSNNEGRGGTECNFGT